MAKEQVSCARLDDLRRQAQEIGIVKLNNPVSPAKLVVAQSIGRVEISEGPVESSELEIPEVALIEHVRFIKEARREAEKSTCWVSKVGALVVDKTGEIVARGHNHAVLEGHFCRDLKLPVKEAINLLKPGERFAFCQAIHDVEGIVSEAARGKGGLRSKKWYLSLEPCDRCANHLVIVEPEAVYFSLGIDRQRYYNSVGLERLIAAGVPTYFVRMPGE